MKSDRTGYHESLARKKRRREASARNLVKARDALAAKNGRPPLGNVCEVVRVMASGMTRVRCTVCLRLYDRKRGYADLRCQCTRVER